MEYKEFSAKTVEEALTEATVQMGITSDQLDIEIVDEGSSGFLGLKSRPATIRVKRKNDIPGAIESFLDDVFKAMGLEVGISVRKEEEDEPSYYVELTGSETGTLIGRRGQTLDALQYLTSLAVNKNTEKYVRIKVDTEDYRERRKKTLENLAKNVASKVKHSKKPQRLDPMNPFERRIIHSALQGDRYVTTHSEGEEPYRYVVVTLKKQEK